MFVRFSLMNTEGRVLLNIWLRNFAMIINLSFYLSPLLAASNTNTRFALWRLILSLYNISGPKKKTFKMVHIDTQVRHTLKI